MKLRPGVVFINILMSSFCARRSLKQKKDWQIDCLFMLLGSAHAKAAHKRLLVKLRPGECESRTPINTTKNAESSDGWEPWTKTSTKNIFQWEGEEVGKAKPEVVDGHRHSVNLLDENHFVDRTVVSFTNILRAAFEPKLQTQTVSREKLCETLSYKKAVCKMLMKLLPVDFGCRTQETKNKSFQQKSEQSESQTENAKRYFVKPACSLHVWKSFIDISEWNVFHFPT